MAFDFDLQRNRLDFREFRPTDLEAALRPAYNNSCPNEQVVTIHNQGYEWPGVLEGHFVQPTMPPARDTATWCLKTQGELYRVITCDQRSPFVRLQIPGVLYLINRNVVACSPILNIWGGAVARAIFNITPGEVRWRPRADQMEVPYRPAWGSMAEVARFLEITQNPMATKKPEVATQPPFDLEKVLSSIFSPAIAIAIAKEIK